MKRILLPVLFVLAAILLSVSAAGATPGSGQCGGNVSWKLDADGTLTISGSGDMADYVAGASDSPFTALGGAIKAVKIKAGVTSVGDNAFYECANVAAVTLPEGLTRIGEGAFYYCRELPEIVIPGSVTEIGRRAFRSCLALEHISALPEGLARLGEKAFDDTAWYKAQPDGPVYLGSVLLACKGEMPRGTEITVREGTRLIADEAFWNCDRMVSLTLPEGLRHIGDHAFYECGGIEALTFPEGLLTVGERAFYCCGLKSLKLPRSLTAVGRSAFMGCSALTSVFVPAGVTEIGPEAFPEKTEIRGYDGTYAQRYAAQMGLKFTVLTDPDAPETTTAPEGERVKARRRKQVGAIVAISAAGLIGVGAAAGLLILRGRSEDDEPLEE